MTACCFHRDAGAFSGANAGTPGKRGPKLSSGAGRRAGCFTKDETAAVSARGDFSDPTAARAVIPMQFNAEDSTISAT